MELKHSDVGVVNQVDEKSGEVTRAQNYLKEEGQKAVKCDDAEVPMFL